MPKIAAIVAALPDVRTVCDLFAGTTRVGQALKTAGYDVWSNDLASYSKVFGQAYIEADARYVDFPKLAGKIQRLNDLPGRRGYFTRTFCEEAMFFQPRNGMRVDAIREAIDEMEMADIPRAILLTSLVEATDRVDNTVGLQMAYLKEWCARSYDRLNLRVPVLLNGSGKATACDANVLAPVLDVDLVYVDPPYNQASYRGNYHIWETLVLGDEPETYGKAMKRVDCRTIKSDYNSKVRAEAALTYLLRTLPSRYVLMSYSNEAYLPPERLSAILGERGHVACMSVDFRRYVGAQIGIHGPKGDVVGAVGHTRNREHLFLVGPDRDVVEAAVAAAS